MKRPCMILVAMFAFALVFIPGAGLAETDSLAGVVRVQASAEGGAPQVQLVGETGEVTQVIGSVRDAIAALEGKKVEVQGQVAVRSDGARTVIAESYEEL